MITVRPGGYRNFASRGERDGYAYTMHFSDHYGYWHCFAVQYYTGTSWQDVPYATRQAVQRRADLVAFQLMSDYPVRERKKHVKICALCEEEFYCYFVDDEICFSCESSMLKMANLDEKLSEQEIANLEAEAEWNRRDCPDCGLPNPICDCREGADESSAL